MSNVCLLLEMCCLFNLAEQSLGKQIGWTSSLSQECTIQLYVNSDNKDKWVKKSVTNINLKLKGLSDGGQSKNLYFQYAPCWEIAQHGKEKDWVTWDWSLPAPRFYASYAMCVFSVCCVEAGCIHKIPLALYTCKIPRANRSRKKSPLEKRHTV